MRLGGKKGKEGGEELEWRRDGRKERKGRVRECRRKKGRMEEGT